MDSRNGDDRRSWQPRELLLHKDDRVKQKPVDHRRRPERRLLGIVSKWIEPK